MNKRKKMMEEADKINADLRIPSATEAPLARQHRRSNSKLSIKLKRDYGS